MAKARPEAPDAEVNLYVDERARTVRDYEAKDAGFTYIWKSGHKSEDALRNAGFEIVKEDGEVVMNGKSKLCRVPKPTFRKRFDAQQADSLKKAEAVVGKDDSYEVKRSLQQFRSPKKFVKKE